MAAGPKAHAGDRRRTRRTARRENLRLARSEPVPPHTAPWLRPTPATCLLSSSYWPPGRGCHAQFSDERFIAGRPEDDVVATGRAGAAVGRTVIVPFASNPLASNRLASSPLASKRGEFFGSTTTLVPISTRLNRSATSSLVRRMQPEETNFPMVEGSLVP